MDWGNHRPHQQPTPSKWNPWIEMQTLVSVIRQYIFSCLCISCIQQRQALIVLLIFGQTKLFLQAIKSVEKNLHTRCNIHDLLPKFRMTADWKSDWNPLSYPPPEIYSDDCLLFVKGHWLDKVKANWTIWETPKPLNQSNARTPRYGQIIMQLPNHCS